MSPFYERFAEVAARETRVVRLPQPDAGLPAGGYAFAELYCTDPDCDCRRVLIQVWPEKPPGDILATINYGWESVEFYTRWLRGDEESGREIVAAELDPLNAQSRLSQGLLLLFRHVVANDPAYVQRLARHYDMFKAAIRNPQPPRKRERRKGA